MTVDAPGPRLATDPCCCSGESVEGERGGLCSGSFRSEAAKRPEQGDGFLVALIPVFRDAIQNLGCRGEFVSCFCRVSTGFFLFAPCHLRSMTVNSTHADGDVP